MTTTTTRIGVIGLVLAAGITTVSLLPKSDAPSSVSSPVSESDPGPSQSLSAAVDRCHALLKPSDAGTLSDAFGQCQQVLALDPSNVLARFALVKIRIAQGKCAKARSEFVTSGVDAIQKAEGEALLKACVTNADASAREE